LTIPASPVDEDVFRTIPFDIQHGHVYPGLMRLEQRGLVRAAWGVTDNNRKARFYSMTAAGRWRLAAGKAEWDRMSSIMHTPASRVAVLKGKNLSTGRERCIGAAKE
jgi:DNA-binding PadR family transcriptional regulator